MSFQEREDIEQFAFPHSETRIRTRSEREKQIAKNSEAAERRRRQNRQAQKKYRERKRQKQEEEAALAKGTPAPSPGYSSSSDVGDLEDTCSQEDPVFPTGGSADLMACFSSPGRWTEERNQAQPPTSSISPSQLDLPNGYLSLASSTPIPSPHYAKTARGSCCCSCHIPPPSFGTLDSQSATGAEYSHAGLMSPCANIFLPDPGIAQPRGSQSTTQSGAEYSGLTLPNLGTIFPDKDTAQPYRTF